MIHPTVLEIGRTAFDLLFLTSVRAAALAALAAVALFLVRSRRPAIEHGVWTAVMYGMLLLPALALVSVSSELAPALTVNTSAAAAALPDWSSNPSSLSTSPLVAAAENAGTPDWQSLAGLLSIAVTAILLLRSLFAWLRARRLVAGAQPATQIEALDLLDASLAAANLDREPQLLASPEITTPVVFGRFRPAILLSSDWTTWSTGKLEAVLAHEVAHVARHDAWILSAASLNAALFWFHPLAGWLQKRLRTLAEMACDDHAVLVARDPETYAEALLEVAQHNQPKRGLPAIAPAMARTPDVTRRIERILGARVFFPGILQAAAPRKLILAAGSAALLLSLVSVTVGQTAGVTLSGSVKDPSGARVPGAGVRIVDALRGGVEATTTSGDGSFKIEGLVASPDYLVEVRAPGFAVYNQVVDLTADQELDVTVAVAGVEEQIVVAGKRADAGSQSEGDRTRVRVGGKVKRARLLEYVSPIYPDEAQAEGLEGTVLLEAVITSAGQPTGIEAVNKAVDRRLVAAAIDAVRQWRYEPVKLNGQPTEVVTSISVAFQLP